MINITREYNKITETIDPSKPMIALTFDDGPNETYTPQVLDILYKNQAYATFFITGKNISTIKNSYAEWLEKVMN